MVRRAVRALAWLYVEVRRGRRPAAQLQRFAAPGGNRGLPACSIPSAQPLVTDADIGRARLDGCSPRLVFAAVMVRIAPPRWEALCLSIAQTSHGRWRLIEVASLSERPCGGSTHRCVPRRRTTGRFRPSPDATSSQAAPRPIETATQKGTSDDDHRYRCA